MYFSKPICCKIVANLSIFKLFEIKQYRELLSFVIKEKVPPIRFIFILCKELFGRIYFYNLSKNLFESDPVTSLIKLFETMVVSGDVNNSGHKKKSSDNITNQEIKEYGKSCLIPFIKKFFKYFIILLNTYPTDLLSFLKNIPRDVMFAGIPGVKSNNNEFNTSKVYNELVTDILQHLSNYITDFYAYDGTWLYVF